MLNGTMSVAKFLGDGQVRIERINIPRPGPDEVLLKVAWCGLCGSERKILERGVKYVPGHEVSGTVVDSNGTGIPEGTRAVAYLPVHCGTCRYCRSGETNRCTNRKFQLGWNDEWPGGYSEYMRVPARNVLPIHDDLGLDEAVTLLDMLGTAWHALRLAGVGIDPAGGDGQKTQYGWTAPPSKALVVGCGPLGLGVVAGLKAFGTAEYYASDISEYRMQAASEFGSTALPPDDVSGIRDLDLIVDVVGSEQTILRSIKQISPGGAVVLLGEWRGSWAFENTYATMLKDYRLIRSWYFPIPEFSMNQQYLMDGTIDTNALISHRLPLEQLEDAFRLFFSGKSKKVLVGPGPS